MLILMTLEAQPAEIEAVMDKIRALGWAPHPIPGVQRVAIGITGNQGRPDPEHFLSMEGVTDCLPVSKPYKLVGRETHPDDSVVVVERDGLRAEVGGTGELALMAGPCSVESREQIMRSAEIVAKSGARFLRGGAYKPRSSPYAFQGMKEDGLKLLAEARREFGLLIVTEVKDIETLPMVAEYADLLQIGARNMHNFSLLEAVGAIQTPILLKRGFAATIEEWLMSAEYVLAGGNRNVILCERGIRTFETATRNTLDLNAIPVVKKLSHLPVIVDPSHGIGLWEHVTTMARASVAAGCDGLIVEMHPDPKRALSDGSQSLRPDKYDLLVREVTKAATMMERPMNPPKPSDE